MSLYRFCHRRRRHRHRANWNVCFANVLGRLFGVRPVNIYLLYNNIKLFEILELISGVPPWTCCCCLLIECGHLSMEMNTSVHFLFWILKFIKQKLGKMVQFELLRLPKKHWLDRSVCLRYFTYFVNSFILKSLLKMINKKKHVGENGTYSD